MARPIFITNQYFIQVKNNDKYKTIDIKVEGLLI